MQIPAYMPFMLSVILMNVIMLSVTASLEFVPDEHFEHSLIFLGEAWSLPVD